MAFRSGLILALLLALPGIGAAQKVTVEFDEAVDFSAFRTFHLTEGKLHSRNPALNSELVSRRIDADLRQQLAAKGLTEVPSQADLNVHYSLGSGRKTEVDRYPARWYGTRTVRFHYTEGTLVLDLRDARRRELVWRGISVLDKSDARSINDHLGDMVRKVLDKYPPKRK
jgi:hypothetical protein